MKTPQRKFTVEFKSARRQPKSRTNSIWGDMDLKALVRDAEDNAPHLFKSNEASGVTDEGRDTSPDLMKSDSSNQPAGDVEISSAAAPPSDDAAVEERSHHEADHGAVEAVVQVHEPVSQPRRISKGTSQKRRERAPDSAAAPVPVGAQETQGAPSRTADDHVSFEELAALDSENKQLKRLLVEQLRLENAQLNKMLERFDVASETATR
ncbi:MULTISPECIES: hypothetical protein [unclassified Sinorhizobium]|uniref:hypothetical protein n=1 Tax=unclassified Sinorhizobium TaxID=2613772 RepID=UPI0035232BAB